MFIWIKSVAFLGWIESLTNCRSSEIKMWICPVHKTSYKNPTLIFTKSYLKKLVLTNF